MFKNLNPAALGVSGRQSELIELALTYGFKGLDFDLADLVKRALRSSFERASRYLASAKMKIGSFELPVGLDDDEATYKANLALLHSAAEIAAKVNAVTGVLRVPPATDRMAYPQYFEELRKRIDEIAGVIDGHGIKVALSYNPSVEAREGKAFNFIQDVEAFLALLRATSAPNVGIVFGSWEWEVGGGNLDHLKGIPAEKVLAVRLSDLAEDVDRSKASNTSRLMPGRSGVIDNVKYLSYLYEAGYRGPVAPYAHPSSLSGRTRDAIVSHAQECLDKTLTAAGVPTQTRRPETYASEAHSSWGDRGGYRDRDRDRDAG